MFKAKDPWRTGVPFKTQKSMATTVLARARLSTHQKIDTGLELSLRNTPGFCLTSPLVPSQYGGCALCPTRTTSGLVLAFKHCLDLQRPHGSVC